MPALPPDTRRYMLKAPLEFRCETVPLPAPADGAYLLRIDACGICRSDLHAAQGWARDWQEEGHEFGGTVVEAPPAARFRPGQRVAVRNASACLECAPCRAGNLRQCARLVVNKQGYRDYCLCDERSLVAADGLDDDLLALVEPVNVALDLLDTARLEGARSVAILGCGTLGLIAAWLVRQRRPDPPLVLIGRKPECPPAPKLGVTAYTPFEHAASQCRSTLHGAPEAVLVTSPPSTLRQAIDLCAPGGTVATLGLDSWDSCRVPLDAQAIIFKRLTLRGSFAVPNLFFEEAISLLQNGGAALRTLITRRIPYSGLAGYFREWHERGHSDGKAILLPEEKRGPWN